jgi:hypothetical protein
VKLGLCPTHATCLPLDEKLHLNNKLGFVGNQMGSTPASMEVSIMNVAWDQVASMENAAPTAIYSLVQNEGECWFGTTF